MSLEAQQLHNLRSEIVVGVVSQPTHSNERKHRLVVPDFEQSFDGGTDVLRPFMLLDPIEAGLQYLVIIRVG